MKKILVLFVAFLMPLALHGQDDKIVRAGIDASVDCFLSTNHKILPSYGIGARVRLGRPDQWVNLVSGLRYIYGTSLSGFQIPILVNVNLLKGRQVSGYLGGGYEFDFIGTSRLPRVLQALPGRYRRRGYVLLLIRWRCRGVGSCFISSASHRMTVAVSPSIPGHPVANQLKWEYRKDIQALLSRPFNPLPKIPWSWYFLILPCCSFSRS